MSTQKQIKRRAELSKNIRIKRDENYEILRLIEQRVSDRIRAEFANEISDIQLENKKNLEEEKLFREQAKEILKTATTETLLKVETQVGKGSTVIQEYTGRIDKQFKYNDGTFNFICSDKYEGKPFTIGFSCLLSIEVL